MKNKKNSKKNNSRKKAPLPPKNNFPYGRGVVQNIKVAIGIESPAIASKAILIARHEATVNDFGLEGGTRDICLALANQLRSAEYYFCWSLYPRKQYRREAESIQKQYGLLIVNCKSALKRGELRLVKKHPQLVESLAVVAQKCDAEAALVKVLSATGNKPETPSKPIVALRKRIGRLENDLYTNRCADAAAQVGLAKAKMPRPGDEAPGTPRASGPGTSQ